jgi:hypothetical protein
MKNSTTIKLTNSEKLELVNALCDFKTPFSTTENSVTIKLPKIVKYHDNGNITHNYATNYFTITFNDDHYSFSTSYHETELDSMYYASDMNSQPIYDAIMSDLNYQFNAECAAQPEIIVQLHSLN